MRAEIVVIAIGVGVLALTIFRSPERQDREQDNLAILEGDMGLCATHDCIQQIRREAWNRRLAEAEQ